MNNLSLAASTVVEHLGDDPAMLALQLSRRLPARSVRPVAAAAAAAPGVFLPALVDLIRGRKNDLEARLTGAAAAVPSHRLAVRLADVAVAAGLPELAEKILAETPMRVKGRPAVEARLCWYQGDMSGALSVLDQGTGTRSERRLRSRLASELSVFDGWAPTLAKVQGFSSEPKSVLHLLTNSLPATGSGYAQRSQSLLHAQHKRGWKVHAVTRLGYPVQVGSVWAPALEVLDGVTYHRLLPSRLPNGMAARLQLQTEAVLRLALEVKPAVLHTTTHFVNGLVAQTVAEALNIPWVYEVRGQLADTWASARGEEARRSERYRKFIAREAETMRAAGAVATLGQAMQSGVVAAGVPQEDIFLLPNAVGEDYLAEPLEQAAARERLGLPVGGQFIGTVSSLVEYEGLDDLLRAFAVLAPQVPNATCLIVGDGAAAPGLKRLASGLGIAERVVFTGRVPREKAHLYHQAMDVFVVPRKDLPVTRAVTPLKPVEALASARPVVFSDLPALHEVVRAGVDGRAAPPENPASLARILQEVLEDDAARALMGNAGRQHTVATRTWSLLAETTIKRYMELGSSL
ncbi:glycosyltransferase family 4 protein [Arthrobacter sp. Edens01]|uniref:glycosyltransferase family 4 protein n=1 Tax=Arthrobacter sp. Edens01 TaxID=1732020 RepID=UPI001F3D3AA7|nr:glycosyltransferase family 4 protein [Arthrobacter sp. Edens01]